MRVYVRVEAAVAAKAIKQGFEDWHFNEVDGTPIVWCSDHEAIGYGTGGPDGDTVLCTDIPEDLFREQEIEESTRPLTPEEDARIRAHGTEPEFLEYRRTGHAMIRADALNRHGLPRIYTHEFATSSRRDLVQAAEKWEAAAREAEDESLRSSSLKQAADMRKAIRFFDDVGWQNVTSIREDK